MAWHNEEKPQWDGFKLHLIVNHQGEIISIKVTAGNVDDREPVRELTGVSLR